VAQGVSQVDLLEIGVQVEGVTCAELGLDANVAQLNEAAYKAAIASGVQSDEVVSVTTIVCDGAAAARRARRQAADPATYTTEVVLKDVASDTAFAVLVAKSEDGTIDYSAAVLIDDTNTAIPTAGELLVVSTKTATVTVADLGGGTIDLSNIIIATTAPTAAPTACPAECLTTDCDGDMDHPYAVGKKGKKGKKGTTYASPVDCSGCPKDSDTYGTSGKKGKKCKKAKKGKKDKKAKKGKKDKKAKKGKGKKSKFSGMWAAAARNSLTVTTGVFGSVVVVAAVVTGSVLQARRRRGGEESSPLIEPAAAGPQYQAQMC
jgi:hypothetical protein